MTPTPTSEPTAMHLLSARLTIAKVLIQCPLCGARHSLADRKTLVSLAARPAFCGACGQPFAIPAHFPGE